MYNHGLRAILHIGTEKTGTKSIQNYLARHREDLLACGILVPRSGVRLEDSAQHFMLSAYACNSARMADMIDPAKSEKVRQEFARALQAELAFLPKGVTQALFSDELCHSRLTSAEDVANLKQFLNCFFYGYRIIVYIRRQDELLISAYSEYLRDGFSGKELLRNADASPHYQRSYCDYLGLLRRWAEVFGREAVVPRIYDRADFAGGNIIADFMSIIAPDHQVRDSEKESNSSFTVVGQFLLQSFNETFGDLTRAVGHKAAWKLRAEVMHYLETHCTGCGRRPLREEAKRFVANFAAENEELRTEWFPGRVRLFSEDFSQYSDTREPEPDLSEIVLLSSKIMAQSIKKSC